MYVFIYGLSSCGYICVLICKYIQIHLYGRLNIPAHTCIRYTQARVLDKCKSACEYGVVVYACTHTCICTHIVVYVCNHIYAHIQSCMYVLIY